MKVLLASGRRAGLAAVTLFAPADIADLPDWISFVFVC
jgi:hypothetical protein